MVSSLKIFSPCERQWNRNLSAYADQDLYYFLLLVIADNAVARAASKGNTVPVIRTAYHMGSHYELYQAEGVSPTVFSYIVGDVTIELARMVDHAKADQILIGDFSCDMPSRESSVGGETMKISTPAFVRNSNRELGALQGIQLSGKSISAMRCQLTPEDSSSEDSVPRRLHITDKHGLSRYAYNLQIEIGLESEDLMLGLDGKQLGGSQVVDATQEFAAKNVKEAISPEKMYDDLAHVLKKRSKKKGNSKE